MTIPTRQPKCKGSDLYYNKFGYLMLGDKRSYNFKNISNWQESYWPWVWGHNRSKTEKELERAKGTEYEKTFLLPGEFFC